MVILAEAEELQSCKENKSPFFQQEVSSILYPGEVDLMVATEVLVGINEDLMK
jgi:hypothetical protein